MKARYLENVLAQFYQLPLERQSSASPTPFNGKVELTMEQAALLRTGQLATLRLRKARGTLGQYVYRSVSDWIENRLRAIRQS